MERGALSIPAHAEPYSVVLLKEEGTGSFLVQKRSKAPGVVYPGRLGLFGGRQEANETPTACAIREVAEECGIELHAEDISLVARLLAHDESNKLSFGHIYIAEDLPRREIRAALRHRCKEGEVRLLRHHDIGAQWRQLTSVTTYAFGAFFDFDEARGEASLTKPIAALAGMLRSSR